MGVRINRWFWLDAIMRVWLAMALVEHGYHIVEWWPGSESGKEVTACHYPGIESRALPDWLPLSYIEIRDPSLGVLREKADQVHTGSDKPPCELE
jgi:hypothetical protein